MALLILPLKMRQKSHESKLKFSLIKIKAIKGFVMIGMSLSLLAICAIAVSTLLFVKMIASD